TSDLVTNMFFLIALFLHLTLPVLVIILVLVHVMRLTKPVIHPPRLTAFAVSLALMALPLIRPLTMFSPADTDRVVSAVGIDFFYMSLYPALNSYPAWMSWAFILLGAALFTSVPWIFPKERPPAANVISGNCVGCGQCREDCPYAAVFMRPRPGKEPEAVVMPERCAGCGICVGACSFAAVAFPLKSEDSVKGEIRALLKDKTPSIIAFVCANAHNAEDAIKETSVAGGMRIKTVKFPCTGMIHPGWAELALDEGASKVFIHGCSPGDCHYRMGNIWLMERLSGARKPQLRSGADREKIFVCLSTSQGHKAAPCPAESLSAIKNGTGCGKST
ncbi:MAG: hydrogenase iron-sulfur subunit, partial [Deltaproteobacteria bacterium]|nr:hydrogenase iron-sulfur subunit [Deltaproteobacteria bacterium]